VICDNNMKFSNFKKAIKSGSEQKMFGKDVEKHLYQLQQESIEAKHADWDSGNSYFLDDVKEAYEKRLITPGLMERFKLLNKKANKALHPK
jgi:hypothetical protein